MSVAVKQEHKSSSAIVDYNQDLCRWSRQQAHFLKHHQWDKLDIHNLTDEILDVTRRDHRALMSYFIVLLTHLLKCKYQPEMYSTSWTSSIGNSRDEIEFLLTDSPSMKNDLKNENWREKAWEKAIRKASDETGIDKSAFPIKPIWSNKEILNVDWFPEEVRPAMKKRKNA